MDRKNKEDIEPEIIEEDQTKERSLSRKEQEKPLATTISQFSKNPLYNKFQKIGLKSFRKVIQEETGLMEDLVKHSKEKTRLKDIEVEIETKHLERKNKLQEAKRENLLGPKKDRIAELELEVKEAELQERLGQIKCPPEKEDKAKKLKKELAEKLIIKKIYQDHEIEKLVLKVKKELRTQQAIDKMFNELFEEILQGRDPSKLSEEESRKLEDLQDFYNNILDEQ